jgi:hypothetical protein
MDEYGGVSYNKPGAHDGEQLPPYEEPSSRVK